MGRFIRNFLLTAVAVMAASFLTFSAAAVSGTGMCGDEVFYSYDKRTKQVLIYGNGEMYDYADFTDSPFYDSDIQSVVIESGVTTVGDYAFYQCFWIK